MLCTYGVGMILMMERPEKIFWGLVVTAILYHMLAPSFEGGGATAQAIGADPVAQIDEQALPSGSCNAGGGGCGCGGALLP